MGGKFFYRPADGFNCNLKESNGRYGLWPYNTRPINIFISLRRGRGEPGELEDEERQVTS